MRSAYLYAEIWPNGRAYIGQTTDTQRRHRQHVGDSANGSKSVKKEIESQGGICPAMKILAIFDLDIKYTHGFSYEQIVTQTAKMAGWDLIYEDMGPAAALELGSRLMTSERGAALGRMNTPAQQEGRVRGGTANTPAQRKARSKNGHEIGVKYGAMNGIKSRAKLTAEQVREIRKRLNAGETGLSLAMEFPISGRSISSIKLGRSYTWVKQG